VPAYSEYLKDPLSERRANTLAEALNNTIEQLRQLGDVRYNPSRLILAEGCVQGLRKMGEPDKPFSAHSASRS